MRAHIMAACWHSHVVQINIINASLITYAIARSKNCKNKFGTHLSIRYQFQVAIFLLLYGGRVTVGRLDSKRFRSILDLNKDGTGGHKIVM